MINALPGVSIQTMAFLRQSSQVLARDLPQKKMPLGFNIPKASLKATLGNLAIVALPL
jgi:hypothetical protein